MNVFETQDKSGRKIHLSKKQWTHIGIEHPEVKDIEQIKETLIKPIKITCPLEEKVYYYQYFKHRPDPDKYLLVIVRYLNGTGFVISAYFVNYMQG